MRKKIKIVWSCLLIIGIILITAWSHCEISGRVNSNCICFLGQLKKKSFLMCDPISCPSFYECVSKEECELEEYYEIIKKECKLIK